MEINFDVRILIYVSTALCLCDVFFINVHFSLLELEPGFKTKFFALVKAILD